MTQKLFAHIRGNAVAYIALFFAIGGGGAAIAATSATTVHGCVNKKTGEMFIVKRCTRSERALSFNERGPTGLKGGTGATGAAGTPATVAWAYVSSNGNAIGSDMSVSETSSGVYSITVTASQCATSEIEAPVVTPNGNPTASGALSGIPDAWASSTAGSTTFVVTSGFIQNGSFVAGNEGFAVQDQCGSN